MEDKRCLNCRYGDIPSKESPCRECIKERSDYSKYWEPEENAGEPKNRPKPLPAPAYLYDRDGRYPDRIRISFEDGQTAVYTLHTEEPHPLVMESIRIIRKWRNEDGQAMQPRRRSRK